MASALPPTTSSRGSPQGTSPYLSTAAAAASGLRVSAPLCSEALHCPSLQSTLSASWMRGFGPPSVSMEGTVKKICFPHISQTQVCFLLRYLTSLPWKEGPCALNFKFQGDTMNISEPAMSQVTYAHELYFSFTVITSVWVGKVGPCPALPPSPFKWPRK